MNHLRFIARQWNWRESYPLTGKIVGLFLAVGWSCVFLTPGIALGDLFVANFGNGTVSRVSADGKASTFASGFDHPAALVFDAKGILYVSNYGNGTISKVAPNGTTTTFASGFVQPAGLAFDRDGNLFVANFGNNTLSRISSAGMVSIFKSFFPPFGSKVAMHPSGLAFPTYGGPNELLYVGLTCNDEKSSSSTLAKINLSEKSWSPTDAPADNYTPTHLSALALDNKGDLVFTFDGHRLGYDFQNPTEKAPISVQPNVDSIRGLAFDQDGHLFISSWSGNTVSKIANNVVTVYAADFNQPWGLAFPPLLTAAQFTRYPQSSTLRAGSSFTLSVVATGFPAPGYQWQELSTSQNATWTNLSDDSYYSGCASANLTLKNPASTLSETQFRCVAANSAGSTSGQPVTITVVVSPTIKQSPQNQSVAAGGAVRLSVEAEGTPPLSYQWFLNGQCLSAAATRPILTLVDIDPAMAGNYTVVVSNLAGQTTSAIGTLKVVNTGATATKP